ncbi:MAG: amino acid permease, partial [Rhodobacter sp.]|nr:amino acid permease [Rhodobacter sp.]
MDGIGPHGVKVGLLRVLGPAHVWALGVGIVLVGEYMGWNFAVGKGGAYAALIACWFAGILYTCVAMIDSEVTSTVASAGGQYTQAKHIVGPLMAFNVGLYLVFAYTMLEAANAITAGYLVSVVATMTGHEGELNQRPFIILVIMFLAWLNYRGVLATLTFNLVITAFAFTAILILFLSTSGIIGAGIMDHAALFEGHELPYGWIGILASLHFGLWYYLGIEGTTQAAEEVRSPARALPFGTLAGIMTLLIAATLTWYVCSGVLPWEFLGDGVNGSVAPLFDTARLSGSTGLVWLLGFGTLFATLASANGCINDASRAWFAMGRDKYLPGWFGAVHPKYRTPYRAIVFLVPIALIFALGAP